MNIEHNMMIKRFPFGFQEDDQLRSQFLRLLILKQAAQPKISKKESQNIPKVLVRFWHEADAVPSDVQSCLRSWDSLYNAGFKIVTYNDISAKAYISENFGSQEANAFARCNHPAMRSDYFRLCYIFLSGGFYVDADDVMTDGRWPLLYGDDCLKLQPLCYDVPSRTMVRTHELWKSNLVESGRIFYVNNNPLVAPPQHPVLKRALERATAALLKTTTPGDIQSVTGPGNLTAALAAHARELELTGACHDFELLQNWNLIAETRWDLSYRADERNWRNVNWN